MASLSQKLGVGTFIQAGAFFRQIWYQKYISTGEKWLLELYVGFKWLEIIHMTERLQYLKQI